MNKCSNVQSECSKCSPPAATQAIAIHWSSCQSLPGPDGPIPTWHTGAALPRPWSGSACTYALVGSSTPRSWRGSDPDCSAASWAEWKKHYEKRKGLFLKHKYIGFQVSQGCVAMQLRWGRSHYNRFIENFLRNVTVKEYCENQCSFAEVMTIKTKWLFFWNTVYISYDHSRPICLGHRTIA